MPPSRAKASSGQATMTSSASGKRSRRGELRARVAHERPPAGGAGEPAERRGVVDRAEDHEPRRGRDDVDEQRGVADLARLGALGPEQLLGGRDARAVELRVAEAALGAAVGAHQQLRAQRRRPRSR